jgi:LPXTG-motif cell wall-anchored protein
MRTTVGFNVDVDAIEDALDTQAAPQAAVTTLASTGATSSHVIGLLAGTVTLIVVGAGLVSSRRRNTTEAK